MEPSSTWWVSAEGIPQEIWNILNDRFTVKISGNTEFRYNVTDKKGVIHYISSDDRKMIYGFLKAEAEKIELEIERTLLGGNDEHKTGDNNS